MLSLSPPSVHNIQALAVEMEACKEEVFSGNEWLSWARSQGALEAGATAVKWIFKYYALKV
jgi:hypothetical protein